MKLIRFAVYAIRYLIAIALTLSAFATLGATMVLSLVVLIGNSPHPSGMTPGVSVIANLMAQGSVLCFGLGIIAILCLGIAIVRPKDSDTQKIQGNTLTPTT